MRRQLSVFKWRWALWAASIAVAYTACGMAEWLGAEAIQPYDPMPHNLSAMRASKAFKGEIPMNYKSRCRIPVYDSTASAANGSLVQTGSWSSTECIETGSTLEHFVDENGKPYLERRWSYKWGTDLIMRMDGSKATSKRPDGEFCDSYVLVPAENAWPLPIRGLLYLVCLCYLFLGIAIVADVFMSAIEKITSPKMIEEVGPDGQTHTVEVKVWNETVANLTLLALGSSAPEILLSLIETASGFGSTDPPGELGPSTIVGSAAFNLLCITAVCAMACPEAKKIRVRGVFFITSFSSVFAYVWLLIVLSLNTPDIIDVWEAWVTFLFFPLLVGVCYCQDQNWFRNTGRIERVNSQQDLQMPGTGDVCSSQEVCDALRLQRQYATTNGTAGDTGVAEAAVVNQLTRKHMKPLNAGHYRVNACRWLGSKPLVLAGQPSLSLSGDQELAAITPTNAGGGSPRQNLGVVEFTSSSYPVAENAGAVEVSLRRRHGFSGPITVRWQTQDLTALAGKHYGGPTFPGHGTITFSDGQTQMKTFTVPILDDEGQNKNRLFTVKIDCSPHRAIGDNRAAVVEIIDDDHPGCISFAEPFVEVAESAGQARLKVVRENGSAGTLTVSFYTEDGEGADAATQPSDYTETRGVLTFRKGEMTKYIEVPVVDDCTYEKTEHFFVKLVTGQAGSGSSAGAANAGGQLDESAVLGHYQRCRVDIIQDEKMTEMVDKIQAKVAREQNIMGKISSSSWWQQFRDAMTVAGENDEDPGIFAYVMHFLTFFWKVLFAFIPPTEYKGGWACFCVALVFIGMVTAMVAEIAGLFGCAVGLQPSITAITFVALGTSLPDTFASKQAATEEEYCDAAVGNVTGSNSVNVFLGLGVSWVVGSMYHVSGSPNYLGSKCFIQPAGALAFSVTIFVICAVICIGTLFVLRMQQGAELGGPSRHVVAGGFTILWMFYVVMSALQTEGHIEGIGSAATTYQCP